MQNNFRFLEYILIELSDLRCWAVCTLFVCYSILMRSFFIYLALVLLTFQGLAQKGDCFIEIIAGPDIKVFLNGDLMGVTSVEENGLFIHDVMAGMHSLRFVKDDFKPQVKEIELKKGQVFSFRLEPFVPVIKISLFDGSESSEVVQRTGDVWIQSLPTSVRVIIKSLDVDFKKDKDKMLLEGVPVGVYKVVFVWKLKRLNCSIEVVKDKTTHIMVNMVKKRVVDLHDRDLVIAEKMEMKRMERERAQFDSLALDRLDEMEKERVTVLRVERGDVITVEPVKESRLSLFEKLREKQFRLLDMNMIPVKGGKFMMGGGSKEARPRHKVYLRSFEMCRYEVTRDLWFAVMGCNMSAYKISDVPISNVRWTDVQLFIRKLNRLTGLNYRLPTEAEWEYAASGGKKSKGYKFSGSNNLRSLRGKGYAFHTEIVGMRLPNELGFYNMTGNVWEICQDTWSPDYKDAAIDGRAYFDVSESKHVVRGGGLNSKRTWYDVRFRAFENSEFAPDDEIGFRLVRDK